MTIKSVSSFQNSFWDDSYIIFTFSLLPPSPKIPGLFSNSWSVLLYQQLQSNHSYTVTVVTLWMWPVCLQNFPSLRQCDGWTGKWGCSGMCTQRTLCFRWGRVCALVEWKMCTKYKLSKLGPCLLGWEGRTGRTVLSESFDLWSSCRGAANIERPSWVSLVSEGFWEMLAIKSTSGREFVSSFHDSLLSLL